VGRVAAAGAADLWGKRDSGACPPAVLVGCDGSWGSADFVPAACTALQTAGCCAVEIGAVTAPSLAVAAHHRHADAALWVGNASGRSHACQIKVWHETGRPASAPGALESLWEGCASSPPRPKRGGGRLERFDAEGVYLPTLARLYHGLRPLVFVLDTTCEPLWRYWRKLSAEAACHAVRLRPGAGDGLSGDAAPGALSMRRETIAGRVPVEGAHFGIWISGDGEACEIYDERGEPVDGEKLFLALCGYVCQLCPGATVVLEQDASMGLERAIERLGARVFRGAQTREGMCERMGSTGAAVGGGAGGRYWYSGPPPACDALWCLSVLVSLLSQSDRPLSEVLDWAPAAG
jgi:phosphomannomutase